MWTQEDVQLTVLSSDMSAHPLMTCASFHAMASAQFDYKAGSEIPHTEVVGIVHASIHTLTYMENKG